MSAPLVTIYTGATGLNTVFDPVRIPFSADTGVTGLSVAVDITLDESGRAGRRPGFSLATAGEFHSLFCDGRDGFVIKERENDAAIMMIAPGDYSLSGVRDSLTKNLRMSFCQVNNQTFYCNGSENGVVENGISFPWPTGEYIGGETSRHFSPAPVGDKLAWHKSRMFIAEGPVVWWSELFRYDLYDKARCLFQFPSRVLMIKPVDAGLFISDENNTYFYQFDNPEKVQDIRTVANYPALEWSDATGYIEGSEIGLDQGLCALWASIDGACMGTAQGGFINLNKDNVVYDKTVRQGAGLVDRYNYIHTMTL